jgi:effector-binding domain-containing protein
MADTTITVKDVAKLHVAELRAISPSFHPVDVGPTISPLYPLLMERLGAAGVRPVGAAIAYYEDDPDGGGVLVHAAIPISDDVRSIEGLEVVDLEPIAQAVCARHRGPMADIVPTVAAMLEWISEHGLRSVGYSREVYLECPPDLADWVTEIQYAVERA